MAEPADERARTLPDVIEAYRGYRPPVDVREAVRTLLVACPSRYLVGLKCVVLTNAAALTGARKRGRSRARGRKVRHREALGLYHAAWKGEAAWIEIFADTVLAQVPRFALRLPVVRHVLLAHTLYHEIGHHIDRVIQPEHRDDEDIAESWELRLTVHMVRGRHPWIARVLYTLIQVRRFFGRRGRANPRP